FHVVINSAIPYRLAIEEDVAPAAVAVARLAHRTDVAQQFTVVQLEEIIQLLRALELVQIILNFGKNARYVSVPLEAGALDQGEDPFHLALVVNVLREDVLVEWVASGTVHEQEAFLAVAARPIHQKLPAPLPIAVVTVCGFELSTRPKDGSLGRGVEPLRTDQAALTVVPQ